MTQKKQELIEKLNEITPYRITHIENECGVLSGKILLPNEEFIVDWIKNNDQGSSSFNHSALSRIYRNLEIEVVWAVETYLKQIKCEENEHSWRQTNV